MEEYGLWDHIRKGQHGNRHIQLSVKHFQFLEIFKDGVARSEMAQQAEIKTATGLTWSRGTLPLLIKCAAELATKRSDEESSSPHTVPQISRVGRHCPKINLGIPSVHGMPVARYEQLCQLINGEYQGLKTLIKFRKMFA